jgi:hypothetical protein
VLEFIFVKSAGFNVKKASSVRMNVIVRCVRVTIVAVGKGFYIFILSVCL